MIRPRLDMAQQNIIWHKKTIAAFASLLLLLFISLSVGLSVGLVHFLQRPTTTTTTTPTPPPTTTPTTTTPIAGNVRPLMPFSLKSVLSERLRIL